MISHHGAARVPHNLLYTIASTVPAGIDRLCVYRCSHRSSYFPSLFTPDLYENSIGRVDTGEGDENVVCRVSVEGLLEKLLVEVVTDETDRSTQNEETVETTREDNQ